MLNLVQRKGSRTIGSIKVFTVTITQNKYKKKLSYGVRKRTKRAENKESKKAEDEKIRNEKIYQDVLCHPREAQIRKISTNSQEQVYIKRMQRITGHKLN